MASVDGPSSPPPRERVVIAETAELTDLLIDLLEIGETAYLVVDVCADLELGSPL